MDASEETYDPGDIPTTQSNNIVGETREPWRTHSRQGMCQENDPSLTPTTHLHRHHDVVSRAEEHYVLATVI